MLIRELYDQLLCQYDIQDPALWNTLARVVEEKGVALTESSKLIKQTIIKCCYIVRDSLKGPLTTSEQNDRNLDFLIEAYDEIQRDEVDFPTAEQECNEVLNQLKQGREVRMKKKVVH